MKNKISSDLLILLIFIVLTFIFVIIPTLNSINIMRPIFGILFILYLPGCVTMLALFPTKNLYDIEMIVSSTGLSIAISPLLGLFLNYIFEINEISLLFIITIYSICLIFLAEYRRRKSGNENNFLFYKTFRNTVHEFKTKNKLDKILDSMLALIIIMTIFMLYNVISTPKIGERFTEFYILGPDEKTDNYPVNVIVGQPTNIMVGISNFEGIPINYTVNIVFDKNILFSRKLVLNHSQTWKENITFIPDKEGKDVKLEFLLFKEHNFSEVYKELHLWVNSLE